VLDIWIAQRPGAARPLWANPLGPRGASLAARSFASWGADRHAFRTCHSTEFPFPAASEAGQVHPGWGL